MATLQHSTHPHHPLESLEFSRESIPIWNCELCRRKIFADAYGCLECHCYYHKVCAEAPPRIECHPLHPIHPLTLGHDQSFQCHACREQCGIGYFRCYACDFSLDIGCALSTLSDRGGSQGTTPEWIILPLHPHPLTSFSTRHDFVEDRNCMLCLERVKEDGYMCLCRRCRFIIHKRCFQDLYYADGTKAPRVYHDHRLETFVGQDTGSRRCANCRSDASGEFIGCTLCEAFIHRDCIQVPEILQYPPHPNHILVLCIYCPYNQRHQCRSCSSMLKGELCYSCTSCEFFVHVGCVLQILAYCEEGMSVEIKWTWHDHPLLLCHTNKSVSKCCCLCGDESTGPTYSCKEDCGFILHEQCVKIEPTIIHPHHPNHPLSLSKEADGPRPHCEACCEIIVGFSFSCKLCAFYLHVKCATRVPTRKHYLHEHELLRFDEVPSLECNRCGTSTDSPLFRCVPCNFNLHEKCLELPQVVKHETHVHPLSLRETYVEDDSGEYYCDLCGERRDGRLGVYVCEICKVTWAFHIECVLPELQKVYAKKSQTSVVKRLAERIARKNEEVCTIEEKLEEVKQELHELVKRHAELLSEEEKNYVAVTEGSKLEKSV